MTDFMYLMTTAGGADPVYGLEDGRNYIALSDELFAFVVDDETGTESIVKLGTSLTLGDEEVIAIRSYGDDGPHQDVYVYTQQLTGVPVIAVVGFATVWEVAADGTSTFVEIPVPVQGYLPATHYVHNQTRPSLRIYTNFFGVFGPEDAILWAPSLDPEDEGFYQKFTLGVYPGFTAADYADPDLAVFEELPGLEPYVVEQVLVAQMYEGALRFNWSLDFTEEEWSLLPSEFWTSAVFEYSWGAGEPGASIPGGGTATTQLYAKYEGSAGPIAGDLTGSSLAGAEDLAAAGYGAGIDDPYYALYPLWYVDPDDGPGYDTDELGSGIASMTITGSYTVTPELPSRETYARVDYEWRPASDLTVITPDITSWGTPTAGAGGQGTPTTSWFKGFSRYWTAVSALVISEHQPYGAGPDAVGGDTGVSYDVNTFTIATRWDEPVGGSIVGDFDLSRARFVRSHA